MLDHAVLQEYKTKTYLRRLQLPYFGMGILFSMTGKSGFS
jgi:hypothetical protein